MARLYLFAEGQTEQTFAGTVLTPHLTNFEVYMHPPVLIAHAKKKGIVHRGGGRNYAPMKNDIRRFLAQEKDGNVFFTTMIDLYAIPADFPRLTEAESLRHLPYERVKALENAFANDIADCRFVPFIQLHEYEAYLFTDPTQFEYFFSLREKQISALKAIADSYESPELINDGPHSAPSKRIIAEISDYTNQKAIVGPQMLELIGLDAIRNKCPHFNSWISNLENLG